jgi:hypothetical protein
MYPMPALANSNTARGTSILNRHGLLATHLPPPKKRVHFGPGTDDGLTSSGLPNPDSRLGDATVGVEAAVLDACSWCREMVERSFCSRGDLREGGELFCGSSIAWSSSRWSCSVHAESGFSSPHSPSSPIVLLLRGLLPAPRANPKRGLLSVRLCADLDF